MAFVLTKKQSASYWDKVDFHAKTEDGAWADFSLDVKFRRWTAPQLAEHNKILEVLEGRTGKLSRDERINLALRYMEDWKVVDDEGTPIPLNAETLGSFFDLYQGAPLDIWAQFMSGIHGRKEKNS